MHQLKRDWHTIFARNHSATYGQVKGLIATDDQATEAFAAALELEIQKAAAEKWINLTESERHQIEGDQLTQYLQNGCRADFEKGTCYDDTQSYCSIPPAFFEKGATREPCPLPALAYTSDMTTIRL